MDKDSGKLGELFDESFDLKHVTWKIPNALSLPDLVDSVVQSPSFTFAGATWILEMFPCGRTQKRTQGCVDLIANRLKSQIEEHYVFLKFHFETFDGKEFHSFPLSGLFNSKSCTWGVSYRLKIAKLMNENNLITSNGDLTAVCQMRIKRVAGTDRHSQTEPATYLLSSDDPTESHLSLCDNKMHSDFKEIFLKQEDCDVIIKVKGKEFLAHRLILKARSPVLASTFRNDMKEKSTGIVDIEDCDPDIFSIFLSFLYSGKVENLSVENVFGLFTTSDKYDVQYLREKCLEFIKENLSVDTFCETISLAILHSETELIKLSTVFFAKNLQEIIVTVKWQDFLAENTTIGNELLVKALVPKKNRK